MTTLKLKPWDSHEITIPAKITLSIEGRIKDIPFPEFEGLQSITDYVRLCNELSMLQSRDLI